MKSITKSLILTLSILWAVSQPIAASAEDQAGCLKLKELRSDYDAVAKGTSMPWQLKFRTHGCHIPVSSPSSTATVSLAGNEWPGLDLNLSYRDYGKKSEEVSNGETTDELNLTIIVTAKTEAYLGKNPVPVVLNYQAIDGNGNLVRQSTPMVIPVKVVASVTEMHRKKASDPLKPLKTVGFVGLVVAMIPVIVVVGIFQMVTGIEIFPQC